MTIAESLNPPASPTASSAFKRARALLESSFPMMGSLWVVRTGMFGSLGMAVQLDWLTSTGYGGSPLCTPCDEWSWLTPQVCQLHAATKASLFQTS